MRDMIGLTLVVVLMLVAIVMHARDLERKRLRDNDTAAQLRKYEREERWAAEDREAQIPVVDGKTVAAVAAWDHAWREAEEAKNVAVREVGWLLTHAGQRGQSHDVFVQKAQTAVERWEAACVTAERHLHAAAAKDQANGEWGSRLRQLQRDEFSARGFADAVFAVSQNKPVVGRGN